MKNHSWIHAAIFSGSLALTPQLEAQSNEPLVPNLFQGVQIGTVVRSDGSYAPQTNAFDFTRLSAFIETSQIEADERRISGNSSYNARAAASTLLGSLSFEVGAKAAFGSSLTAGVSTSNASQSQNIQLTSLLVGTNRLAFIDFPELSPSSLMDTLNSNLQSPDSSLSELITAVAELTRLLETSADPNSPAARQLIADIAEAQASFRDNWGVGFVSGVVLGGAAAVRTDFVSRAATSETRWNSTGRIYGASAGNRFEFSTAFGTMNVDQAGSVRFDTIGNSIGGPVYSNFARDFVNLFANRALTDLWQTSFAQVPDPGQLFANQLEPNLPTPPTLPPAQGGLASKFAPIRNREQLDLFNQALAFDKWNVDGNGTFEQFEAFQMQQAAELLENDPTVNEPLLEGGGPLLRRRAAANPPPTLESSLLPEEVETAPEPTAEADESDNEARNFRNQYWAALQQQYAVVGVETTRWEDVIPGLGFADALINNTLAAREFVEASLVLQAFRQISNMYSLAAACVQDGTRTYRAARYVAPANDFLAHEAELGRRIARIASPMPIVRNYLATELTDRQQAIYQVFILNRDLFTAGEVGMGAYGIWRRDNPSSVQRRRFGGLRFSRTDGRNGRQFSSHFLEAGNNPDEFHSPFLYAKAAKFFPVLEPDIQNFVADGVNSRYRARIRLMGSMFNRNNATFTANGFFARIPDSRQMFSSVPSDDVLEFPLENVRDTTVFGRREFHLTVPSNPKGDLAFNGAERWPAWYSQEEINLLRLAFLWNGERLTQIRLVPFTTDDLSGVDQWRGFIAYEMQTQTLLEAFWQEITENFVRIQPGINYFTTTFTDRNRPIDLNRRFEPADLGQFLSYFGIVSRPNALAR